MRRTRVGICLAMAALGALVGCLVLAGAPALATPLPYLPTTSLSATGPDQVTTESSTGDLFVTDPGANKVIKLGPEGTVLGEVTGAETPQGAFGLSSFHGLAVDNSSGSSEGDVYIASYDAGASHEPRPVVDKFKPKAGHPNEYEYVCELVGSGAGCHKEAEKEGFTPTAPFESYEAPLGVAVGPTGEVYVADWIFLTYLFEFGPEGKDVAGSPLGGVEEYDEGTFPLGIALDATGDIYLVYANTSLESKAVVKVNSEGKTVASALAGAGAGSSAVAVDPASGEVFVLNGEKGYVTRYDSTGAEIEKFGESEVGGANEIAYSAKNGDVYVTDESKNLIHVFALEVTGPKQPLTVKVEGAGTVTCEIEGSGEPEACASEYPENDKLVLTAKADPGSTFEGWSEACTGTGECKGMMSAPVKVTVKFTANHKVALTITNAGSGTGEVKCEVNKDKTFVPCAPEYSEGTELVLEGAPSAGSTFEGWSAGTHSAKSCTGTSSCVFTLAEASAITATFPTATKSPLTVFVTGKGEVNGTLIKNCTSSGGTCTEEAEGEVTLTAKAEAGYVFAGWIGCKKATETTCNVDVTAPSEVTAVFLHEGKEGSAGQKGEEGKEGPAGTKGGEGKEGPAGKAKEGPAGEEGPAGPAGRAGPAGAGGKEGPAGKEGSAGKEGPAGKVEIVTCKKVRKRQRCKTKLVSGSVTFTATGSVAQATLSRHGAVYAAGTAHSTRGRLSLRLLPLRKLRSGHYTLTLISGFGRHETIHGEPFTLL